MKSITMPHLKDSGVTFDEASHRYFLPDGKEVFGITQTLIKWLFPDTYKNIPSDVLKEAARHGSYVHKCIEMATFVGATEACPESKQYLDLLAEHEMTVVANEYLVTDYKYFASAIDIVLMDHQGGIWLVDTKTTSSLYKPKVVAQLSVYAYWFEQMNPDLKVKGIIELWLPKENYRKSSYEPWQILERIQTTDVASMIEAYCNMEHADEYVKLLIPDDSDSSLPAKYHSLIEAIAEQERMAKEIKSRTEEMKTALLKVFKENGVKKFETPKMTMTYIEPSRRKSVDADKLKTEYPDVYAKCIRESVTKDSIKITLR